MRRKSIMIIAGEASGDELAAELVKELREEIVAAEGRPTTDYQPLRTSLEPHFFGAGGPRMAEAGVELVLDMTAHSVTGLWEVAAKLPRLARLLRRLRDLAIEQKPDAVICVDFGGFNLRLAHAVRSYARSRSDWFHDWHPKIVQYVSPQVWGSRPGRAYRIANDYDLLLSIIPFEREWYAKRLPRFPVEFVGHPIVERHQNAGSAASGVATQSQRGPTVLLLPGSRKGELVRHVPVMVRSLALMKASMPEITARMVLPNAARAQQAREFGLPGSLEVQVGNLPEALREAQVAIASTGTVTLECAWFGLPTVAIYKTAFPRATYEIGKRMATVEYLAMPNLLANEEIFPEFILHEAVPEKVAGAALELLRSAGRREKIRARCGEIVKSLGEPGAARRAARAIARLMEPTI